MHTDAEYVARAIDGGADGYLLKDSAVQDLVAAIGAVMAGRRLPQPGGPARAERGGAAARRRAVRPIDLLTDREREVLKLVAEGSPPRRSPRASRSAPARSRVIART